MRWVLATIVTACLTAGCDRLFKLEEFHHIDGQGSGNGDGGIPIPAACTPVPFDGQTPFPLFASKSTSALTLSYDEQIFIVEVKGSPNALYRRYNAAGDTLIEPPGPGDEMAEPTIDPEGNVMYARDRTAGDTIVAYERVSDTFVVAPALSLPTGHRAGNQTLELGGSRRMVVQYDPGTAPFVFNEYDGSPTTGWNLTGGTALTSTELAGSATAVIEDPSLSVDGLNLTFTVDGNVYSSHRKTISLRFAQGTKLLTGSFSSPVLGNSCRKLFVVDKASQVARRYENP